MNLNIFRQTQPASIPTESFVDQEKNKEIVTKLFEKRKAIMWNLTNREESTKKDYEEELAMNDLDMATFGVTKIDYEIYLASKKDVLH